ncbi:MULTISPECIES: 23S rRNA pseudouridine(2605) synthase RluB [Corallincola]|uniref:Pseudouridine synthase n=3 Tax=Corallincola TaxID=1775176 RepID=A0A368NK36_9GAMM|nr:MULTISPECIES: 23S rRNA pseudouridine(2605) synthase RluB [Corallincola]RCU50496.1 23S rRNA pseudouridine(2605) synthase RluB [Corallincola holothuriorum]TAA48497.1 23S rRNA pseudouridine(2605) synthase RluB [Corallincola spongiicola]TCI01821.1 23S rRNA pseudouridine(2605) synthase RluB [Corallincola luteus]
MSEKLQKVLARAGLGSRREVEQWIAAGRVSVDGDVVELGTRVEEDAKIRVDGKLIRTTPAEETTCRVIMYHKPEGEVCTRNDPESRRTVFDNLPKIGAGRWIAVGRLDLNTSGLMLFTNDGELANRLMHPSFKVEREYASRVFGDVSDDKLKALRKGVMLEDGKAKFDKIQVKGGEGINQWFYVTLSEGRNREVRRLWESQELKVSRLIRVRYGALTLPRELPQSTWRELSLEEVNYLREEVQLPKEDRSKPSVKSRIGEQERLRRVRRSVSKHRSQAHRRVRRR